MMRKTSGLLCLALCLLSLPAHAEKTRPEITILSTMVANLMGEGEWGFSALIETPGGSVLFDTGFKSETVLNNAKLLGVDLSATEIEFGEVDLGATLSRTFTLRNGGDLDMGLQAINLMERRVMGILVNERSAQAESLGQRQL